MKDKAYQRPAISIVELRQETALLTSPATLGGAEATRQGYGSSQSLNWDNSED